MRVWVRIGLVLLGVAQLGVGVWALLLPRAFFAIPVVGMGMPYNPHLMMDYGALSVATSIVLGVAAVTMRPGMIRTALAVFLAFAVPHLLIHVRFLHHLPPDQGAWLLTWLGLAVVVPVVLWVLGERARRG
ncbi:hypothetical protein [Saccharopolyspora taberi]|uniref:Uncharacterized protein n=1 Tax=Saccharopolyspora taberi TaxID=60895 RepID=A0ABN3V8Y5_9PSEU